MIYTIPTRRHFKAVRWDGKNIKEVRAIIGFCQPNQMDVIENISSDLSPQSASRGDWIIRNSAGRIWTCGNCALEWRFPEIFKTVRR